MSSVRKAVIPVAGLGTRFLPATKAIPKELLPLGDIPVIQHIVQEAVESGITEIIFVTSEDKLNIEKHFERDHGLEATLKERGKEDLYESIHAIPEMAKFVYVHQREPLGLGHAVLQAKEVIDNQPFIVFGGDDVMEATVPVAKQLIDVYDQYNGPVIAVREVPVEDCDRYGVVDPEEQLSDTVTRLKGMVEKPAVDEAPSNLAVTGRWLLTPDIFEELESTTPGAGNEIQLTDAIMALFAKRQVYAKKYDGIYRDCGNKLEYLKAVVSFGMANPSFGEEFKEYIRHLDI